MPEAALLGAAYALFHVPDLVRYGSKPSRQIARDPTQLDAISAHLRAYDAVVAYPPNQAFIGNLAPEALEQVERPRFRQPMESAREQGPFGQIFDQDAFYAWPRPTRSNSSTSRTPLRRKVRRRSRMVDRPSVGSKPAIPRTSARPPS